MAVGVSNFRKNFPSTSVKSLTTKGDAGLAPYYPLYVVSPFVIKPKSGKGKKKAHEKVFPSPLSFCCSSLRRVVRFNRGEQDEKRAWKKWRTDGPLTLQGRIENKNRFFYLSGTVCDRGMEVETTPFRKRGKGALSE